MKIVKFTSGDTYTPFAPWWEYYFCEDNLKISLTDLKEEILSKEKDIIDQYEFCLLYTSPSPRDLSTSRMPSSA